MARFERNRVLGDAWKANIDDLLVEQDIDCICFTGDAADWGKPDEFEAAATFLSKLRDWLRLPASRLFVVPGNHDIDRAIQPDCWYRLHDATAKVTAKELSRWLENGVGSEALQAHWRTAIFERQSAYRTWVSEQLACRQCLPLEGALGYRATIDGLGFPFDVTVAGLDSAWLSGSDADANRLRLTEDQVMRVCTNDGDRLEGLVIGLLHHPLWDLETDDRTRCIDGLHRNTDLLLRGHLHQPTATATTRPTGTALELAAGCLFESAEGSDYTNGVQLIDLNLDATGRIVELDLSLRSWSSQGHWHADDSRYPKSNAGRIRMSPSGVLVEAQWDGRPTAAFQQQLPVDAENTLKDNRESKPTLPVRARRSKPNHDSTTVAGVDKRVFDRNGKSCLVVIYGPGIGTRLPVVAEPFTIGRGDDCDICLDMNNVSREHARVSPSSDGVYLEDLESTNGTYVNDVKIGLDRLRNGDHIKIGGSVLKFVHGGDIEALYHEELYRMTITDGLTQVFNKRYFLEFLEREMARCLRYDRPLCVVLFDIDHIKEVNDKHGHLAGDHLLRQFAQLAGSTLHVEEAFARYDGGMFATVMPETDGPRAKLFADRVRRAVEVADVVYDHRRIPVTISAGVAEMDKHYDPLSFVKAAYEMLYQAKGSGRNCVFSSDMSSVPTAYRSRARKRIEGEATFRALTENKVAKFAIVFTIPDRAVLLASQPGRELIRDLDDVLHECVVANIDEHVVLTTLHGNAILVAVGLVPTNSVAPKIEVAVHAAFHATCARLGISDRSLHVVVSKSGLKADRAVGEALGLLGVGIRTPTFVPKQLWALAARLRAATNVSDILQASEQLLWSMLRWVGALSIAYLRQSDPDMFEKISNEISEDASDWAFRAIEPLPLLGGQLDNVGELLGLTAGGSVATATEPLLQLLARPTPKRTDETIRTAFAAERTNDSGREMLLKALGGLFAGANMSPFIVERIELLDEVRPIGVAAEDRYRYDVRPLGGSFGLLTEISATTQRLRRGRLYVCPSPSEGTYVCLYPFVVAPLGGGSDDVDFLLFDRILDGNVFSFASTDGRDEATVGDGHPIHADLLALLAGN